MPSPFPGMNPYFEKAEIWEDFHTSFISTAKEMLAPLVRPNYLVRIEQNVFIHELPRERWRPLGKPDVSVVERPGATRGKGAGLATIDAPAEIELFWTIDEVTKRYLEVVDRQKREVVSVIELLSPSNKYAGPDREQYLSKRLRVFAGQANLVEIDLLRGGPRLPLGEPAHPCDYYVFISRASERPRAKLWPIHLRHRLPAISIPLKGDETPVTLDLQAVLDHVYDAGTYDLEIYDSAPEPPLSAEDAEWAKQFLPPRPA